MQSSLIGKIEKAKRYAQETDRVSFAELAVEFRGDNDNYKTSYKGGKWHCSCHFFANYGICSHSMLLFRSVTFLMLTRFMTEMLAVVILPPFVPHPSVRDGSMRL